MTGLSAQNEGNRDGLAATAVSRMSFTWKLVFFLLFNVAVINGLSWWLSPGGFNDTALKESWDVLRGVGGDDSWGPMAAALGYLEEPGDKPLYSAVFFDQGVKFQYPPSALFALEGMLMFGEDHVRTYDEMVFAGLPPVNDFIGWAFLLLTALSSAALLEAGLRKASASYTFDRLAVLRAALVFGFTLTFFPAMKAFTLGQIQLWINSIFALTMMLFVFNRRWASGVLMSLVCLMKPHYGLFALWAGLNREWRFGIACVAVSLIGLAASIWLYGWMNHLDYLRVLSFMSERGESYYANQSINGVLNRLAGLGAPNLYPNVNFNAYGFPPYTAWVYWGTLMSSAVILLTAFLRRSDGEARPIAFAIVGVSLTLASPIAWEHHYGIFLPVFAYIAGTLSGDQRKLVALAISYIFVSNYIPAFNLLANSPFNVLQSYRLAGGLALLILMHIEISSVSDRTSPYKPQVAQGE